MSEQSFRSDVERIQRQIVQIKADLNKRDQLKKQGKPLGLIEGDIRGGLSTLERELDILNTQLQGQEKQGGGQLQKNENEKKRNQYNDFVNQKNDLKARFNDSIQQARDQLFQQQNQNKPQFSDKHDTLNMSNKDLYAAQKQLEKDQDKQLDAVNDKLGNIKNQGLQMNTTIKDQNKMLDQINVDVDQTTKEMIQTNTKMKQFIAKSSTTCLYIVIALEIVGVILLAIPY